MASRAFEPDAPEIPEIDLGKISGSKPQIARTAAASSYFDNEAGLMIAGNARTRGMNLQW